MSKPIRQKPIMLTVVIAFVIITVAFIVMILSREIMIDNESYTAEKRFEKLADDLLKEYEYQNNIHVEGTFNDKNWTGIVAAVDDNRKNVVKLYINYNEIGVYEPIFSITPELDRMFEMDTETLLMEFCNENKLDYENSTISDIDWEKFSTWLEKL